MLKIENFDAAAKLEIEAEIDKDFQEGLCGIRNLPVGARFGVYVSFVYYYNLFKKIKKLPPSRILNERIRVSDNKKYSLIFSSYIRHRLNWI